MLKGIELAATLESLKLVCLACVQVLLARDNPLALVAAFAWPSGFAVGRKSR